MTKDKCQAFLVEFKQLYTTGKRKEAVELIRDFFKDYRSDNSVMDDCLKEIEKASEQWKQENTPEAYYINAYSKGWSENNEDRIANLKKAIELDENFVYAYNGLGSVYDDLKEYDKAILNYKKAIELDENFVAAYSNLSIVYYNLKEYDKAILNYKKAIELDENYIYAYYGLGNVYLDLKDHEKAIFNYKKAIELDENFDNAYYNLGIVYNNLKNYEKAKWNYEKAIELDPNYVHAYNGLGNVYFNLKDYEKAKWNYEKAIELDENNVYAYNGLGNVYNVLKEYEKAKWNYEKAIELDENFVDAYNGLGSVYFHLKEYDKALVNYNKAITLDTNFGNAYNNRAIVNKDLNLYHEAIADYKQYIKLSNDPNDIFIEFAQENILDLKKILENKDYDEVDILVQKIKTILYFDKQCVTHYTSFKATKLLLINGSKLQISEGSFLNDTSEGKQLFKYLNWENAKQIDKNEVAITFTEKPFVGSFVAEHEHNNLALWRMYGKEEQDEAKGCAITIDKDKFIDALKAELEIDKDVRKTVNDDIFAFYHLAYKKEDDSFILPFAPNKEDEFNKLMKELKEKLKDIGFENEKAIVRTDVTQLLNKIAYLFKTAEYQYEHEVRMVNDGVGFEKKYDENKNPPKVYIDLANILPAVVKLTLGPKVEKPDEWAAHFNYKFIAQGFKNINIVISRLPYK